ncbi:uncharacterized protein LOC130644458 [Hydractinia symbiolongicarpus]|uniref:uncharacterized protein LOC130644458 n=1 Tax=Hydractinia symbiolongicarpus TaxID=13093 RepID=UPI00254E0EDF|nr:uncharacterized protein LOC130644458 [Hydractinia symbiolongicarpus]
MSLPQGPILANLGSNFTLPECFVVSEPTAKVTWKRGYGSFPESRVHVANGNLYYKSSCRRRRILCLYCGKLFRKSHKKRSAEFKTVIVFVQTSIFHASYE